MSVVVVCRADSVTWNPHKALHVPLQCSAFITRHERILQDMLSMRAPYLFQQDKVAYDKSLDTGDMSLQCGRLNDALKIWLMWKKSVSSKCGTLIMHYACIITGSGLVWRGSGQTDEDCSIFACQSPRM